MSLDVWDVIFMLGSYEEAEKSEHISAVSVLFSAQ